jgi:membrane protein
VLAAVLWESAKQAFTFYATYVGYGTGTEALGNTFGLIVAFVFWVYFSGIVLMIGAVVASLREHRHVTAGKLPRVDLSPEISSLAPDLETSGSDLEEASEGSTTELETPRPSPPSSSSS